MPRRLRISRARGAHLPPGAVRVDRATVFGNPFRADDPHPVAVAAGMPSAAAAFRAWLTGSHADVAALYPERKATLLSRLDELHGRDLACWCGPTDECHADVLIDVANGPPRMREWTPPSPLPHDLPPLALSVRQPWAWAILHAGKDIENRSWQAVNHGLRQRGRIAVHAAAGMTKDEYWEAREFIDRLGYTCPDPHALFRGGICGSVEVIDVVGRSDSPWFFGPRGLVLREPRTCPFVPAKGALGYFRWSRGDEADVPPPAKWMRPADPVPASTIDPEPSLPLGDV
ncbi:MAG: DUF4326 domain-containing protein [Hyphomicrobium sp.]|nr:DUF4326 domain-containing protein [Hyphomicrobium sp.]